ncbi:MAG: zinc-ribbon domain-containing protein [Asticcacaulis sp.]
MILTCPECATSYSIPDGAIAPEGRKVRCAACKTSWLAMPEPALELDLAEAVAEPDVQPVKDMPKAAKPEPKGREIPKLYREMIEAQKRLKGLATQGLVWGGLVAGFALVLTAAYVFRIEAVRLMPSVAGAYAAVGLPVNAVGLEIIRTSGRPILSKGRFAAEITATVRNITDKAITVPPVHAAAVDVAGKPVTELTLLPGTLVVPAGETAEMVLVVPDPMNKVSLVELGFDLEAFKAAEKAKKAKGKTHAAAPAHKTRVAHDSGHADKGHDPADSHAPASHAAPATDTHGPAHEPATPPHPAPGHGPETHAPASPGLRPALPAEAVPHAPEPAHH